MRDIVIGMPDGLTVPFALSAGLSSIFVSTNHIVLAGFAQLAAGSIALGLGGYFTEKSEKEHFHPGPVSKNNTSETLPDQEREEVIKFFENLGLSKEIQEQAMDEMTKDKKLWSDFVMKFAPGSHKPDQKRAGKSAFNIAIFYILGGMIPLSPYFFADDAVTGLKVSAVVTLTAMFIFGYLKNRLLGLNAWSGGLRMVLVGALAAGCALGIARIIS